MRKFGIFFGICCGVSALGWYFSFMIKSSITMAQLACGVLICIISCLLVKRKALKTRTSDLRFTRYQEDQIKRAREEDAANVMLNDQRKKAAYAELGKKIKDCRNRIKDLNNQAQVYVNNMEKLDILGRDEWNTEAVDFLIRALESHRANNISEALRLYDEDNRRRQDAMHRQAQQWLLEFDAKKKHEEQLEHNRRMEELERERLKETKKIKESLKETEKYIDRLKGY